MANDVIYPGGVGVSDALHTVLQGVNQHPQGGEHSVVSAALAAGGDQDQNVVTALALAGESPTEEATGTPDEKNENIEEALPPALVVAGASVAQESPSTQSGDASFGYAHVTRVPRDASPSEAPETGQIATAPEAEVTQTGLEVSPPSPANAA